MIGVQRVCGRGGVESQTSARQNWAPKMPQRAPNMRAKRPRRPCAAPPPRPVAAASASAARPGHGPGPGMGPARPGCWSGPVVGPARIAGPGRQSSPIVGDLAGLPCYLVCTAYLLFIVYCLFFIVHCLSFFRAAPAARPGRGPGPGMGPDRVWARPGCGPGPARWPIIAGGDDWLLGFVHVNNAIH